MTPGKRRPKPTRAQLRSPELIDIRQVRMARQRRRLASLISAAVAVLVTAAIVYGSGPPLPYRVGQRPSRDLRVNVPKFRRLNQVQTNRLREQAARAVPPIFENDPAPISELQKQLQDLIDLIANEAPSSLDDLPDWVTEEWSLDEATLEVLRTASDTPERRDDLRNRIAEAFAPLIRSGVLARGVLPQDEEMGTMIDVRRGAERLPVSRDRVLPERIVRPDGTVGAEFVASFIQPSLGRALFELVGPRLVETSTLEFQEELTSRAREAARDRVEDYYDVYPRGRLIVEQGQLINEDQMELLRLEHAAAMEAMGSVERLQRAAAIVVLVAALYVLIGAYILRNEPGLARSPGRLAGLCGVAVVALGLARLLAMQPWEAELIPIALASMVLAVAYNPLFALVFAFGSSLLTSLALGTGLGYFIVLLGGTACGVLLLRDVRTRTKPIHVGVAAAIGYALLTAAVGFWQDQPLPLIGNDCGLRGGWGLLTGFLLGGCLPFAESAFGIMTGISLLELGDVNHPLLQELVRRAPGTHNHSITVGTISEAAAEKVGADALLVRVGAYFHDIGKMLKPHYFIENQVAGGVNRHANLAPAMSTLIIIGHVKDGAELARQHKLPSRIIDLIEQHHGTTLVEYFYHQANQRRDGDPDAATIQESAFRYPGPKPQSKEAAILMMSDAVESASRTLSDPTPARLEGLVSAIIDKRLRDGQFDQCDLTLREISTIRESLIKSLIGIYHGRVKYPEQRTA